MEKYRILDLKNRKPKVFLSSQGWIFKERFEEMIKEGRFVEHTLYNGNYYGSTKDQIAPNKCVVIDPAGLRAYIALNDPTIVTFFLDTDEETRFKRMLLRGDKKEDAEKRIAHDRIAFKEENIAKVDFHINNQDVDIDKVTDDVYKKYQETLKQRKK